MDKLFLKSSDSQLGLKDEQIEELLSRALKSCPPIKKALFIPPDITRSNSYAGYITRTLYNLLPNAEIDIMPALGTHIAMTHKEIEKMYPDIPKERFLVHRWRQDVLKLGDIPADFIEHVSEGKLNVSIPVEVNRRIVDPTYDIIISIGQVVPHEVAGMSNFNKNIFVGCGGSDMINYSHYLGALYGMERVMGQDNSPVHQIFDYAENKFISHIPIMYILTVTTIDANNDVLVQSVSSGRERELFSRSIEVSRQHNLNFLDAPLKKIVTYLEPEKFHTTWLGNKAIYRTRMAMADGGRLIVVAPGVRGFGEDSENDALIRKYGYWGRDKILSLTENNEDLKNNLGVAAHLIHGSSEGRFDVTYVTEGLTKHEVENAGFNYAKLDEILSLYDINTLKDGFNIVNGEEIFFIRNPASGLWLC